MISPDGEFDEAGLLGGLESNSSLAEEDMASCDLCNSCFFYNELLTDMPQTTEYLRDIYCNGRFTDCTLYRMSQAFGQEKVPKYLYPNDIDGALDFDLAELNSSSDTVHKVIYTDGTAGIENAAKIGALRRGGKVVAFHWSGGWVEVRRKNKSPYSGADRRKTKPEMFFDGFKPDNRDDD